MEFKMVNPDNYKIKTALISVSDKTGIIEFAKELEQLGITIYSTGGTAKELSANAVNVKQVSELTNFPEILDGRVKTLHPAIHSGLLAKMDNDEHLKQLADNGFQSIDMVVVNLYPFEETLKKEGVSEDEIIENIDIGGPTMLRAAAKNYEWTVVVVNPSRYGEIIETLKSNDNAIPLSLRKALACEVFELTSYYDSIIAEYFLDSLNKTFPAKRGIGLNLIQKLRYGENPHQDAALFGKFNEIFEKLHGKELSYNNILDIDSAARLIIEFDEPTFVIIKHTNPCGVGCAENLCDAYEKAFATDTVSPFGGIFIVNRTFDLEIAEKVHQIFSEVIIAPDYTNDALELLTKKKDRRLIRMDNNKLKKYLRNDLRSVVGGYLIQNTDLMLYNEDNLKVVTKRSPTDEEMKALLFGWKVAKHVKSNTIVFAKSDRTLGIGAGQMSRVDSARIAAEKARMMGLDLTGSAVASDAFFPFADGLLQVVEAGATAVIQPGGSVRDEEVIRAADENNVAMIFTGMRHFKH